MAVQKRIPYYDELFVLVKLGKGDWPHRLETFETYHDQIVSGNLTNFQTWKDNYQKLIDRLREIKKKSQGIVQQEHKNIGDFIDAAAYMHIFELLPEGASESERQELKKVLRLASETSKKRKVNDLRVMKRHLPKGTRLLARMLSNKSKVEAKEEKEVVLMMKLNNRFRETYQKIRASVEFLTSSKRPLYRAEQEHLVSLVHELIAIVKREFEEWGELDTNVDLEIAWMRKEFEADRKEFPREVQEEIEKLDQQLLDVLKRDTSSATESLETHKLPERPRGKHNLHVNIGTPGFYFQEIIIIYGTHSSEKTAQEMAMIAYDFLKQKGFPVRIVGQWQDLDRKMMMMVRKRKGKKMEIERSLYPGEMESNGFGYDSISNKERVYSSSNPRAVVFTFHNTGLNKEDTSRHAMETVSNKQAEERKTYWCHVKDTTNWRVRFLFDPKKPYHFTLDKATVDKKQGHIWCGPFLDNVNLCVLEFPQYYKNVERGSGEYWKGASPTAKALFHEGDPNINQYFITPDLKKTYNSSFSPKNLAPLFLRGFIKLINDTYNNKDWIEKFRWKLEKHTNIF
tara:strand:- start:418 stop:2124 length:1707 start_codon:yes stop_codon:yes gene_type:complete